MKTIFLIAGIVIGSLSAVLLHDPAPPAPPPDHAGTVVKVLGGDTVRLLDGRVVRLAWIKTPPLDQPGGSAAARALDVLTLDRRVVLVNLQQGPGPAWTATVLIDGDRDAAWLMLKAGYAEHHGHETQPPADAEMYGFAHAEARENGRGLWPRRPVIHPRALRNTHSRACGDYPPPHQYPPAPVSV